MSAEAITLVPANHAVCFACNKPMTKQLLCGNCREIAYCTKACQETNWKIHRIECLDKSNVTNDNVFVNGEDAKNKNKSTDSNGVVSSTVSFPQKRLFSSKLVEAGGILFQEKPLVFSPWSSIKTEKEKLYSEGDLPLIHPTHLLAAAVLMNGYTAKKLASKGLRVMKHSTTLLKKEDHDQQQQLLERSCVVLGEFMSDKYNKTFNDLFKVNEWNPATCTELMKNYMQEIMLVNKAYGRAITDSTGCKVYGKAIYSVVSFAGHSCNPNTRIEFDEQGIATIVALVPIHSGDELTIHFAPEVALSSHELRISLLATNFLFVCKCSYCQSEENEMKKKQQQSSVTSQLIRFHERSSWKQLSNYLSAFDSFKFLALLKQNYLQKNGTFKTEFARSNGYQAYVYIQWLRKNIFEMQNIVSFGPEERNKAPKDMIITAESMEIAISQTDECIVLLQKLLDQYLMIHQIRVQASPGLVALVKYICK